MAGYYDDIDPQTLQAAQDWYIRRLKANMGVGPADGLANPDGSDDNYRGFKAAVNFVRREKSRGKNMVDTSYEDENLDKSAYLADPTAWEQKARNSIQGWTVGHEDNQQYMYDPKTGKFAKQWLNDTSSGDLSLARAIAMAAGAYGAGTLLAGAGAGSGVGSAALANGQTLTPALMESAMGSAGYGASSVSGALTGAAAAGGGAEAANVVEAINGGAGTPQVTNAAQIESAVNTPGYGATSAGGGANAAGQIESLADVLDVVPSWAKDLGSGILKGANVVGKFAADNPTLTMFGLNTVAGVYNAQKNREQNEANNQASAERQKAADDAAMDRTKVNNQAQLDQQNNSDRIKQEAQRRYNDSFSGLKATKGILRGNQKALSRTDGSQVFKR